MSDDSTREDLPPLDRWRLVLGDAAQDTLEGSDAIAAYNAALAFLYDRDALRDGRGVRTGDRKGSTVPSGPTVPEWLDAIHTLFPKEAVERLERDAVERYGLEEIVTDPDVLERVEPSQALLRAVLRTKHRMNPELLARARRLVAKVVQQLVERLSREVRAAHFGSLDRRRASPLKVARNLDLPRTLRRNLKHYDPETARIRMERPYFFSRTRRYNERWQLILLVDQSGSMLDSTIHSAITAACLWGVPGLKTHLLAFDTSVVDLTAEVTDPVELLMRVQLGGGTDIARALAYAAGLIENPRRTIVALVTDFYDSGDRFAFIRQVRSLVEAGVHVLGLAALDARAAPDYDRNLARECAAAGAHVGAMTPGELATFVAEKVGR